MFSILTSVSQEEGNGDFHGILVYQMNSQ